MREYLIALIFLTSFLQIRAKYINSKKQEYVFKHLTTSLIILVSYLGVNSNYRNLIILAMIFSLIGDILLILDKSKFIYGLLSFLIAHLIYIFAFTHQVNFRLPYYIFLPFILYGILIYKFLENNLGKLKIAVVVYIFSILIMGLTAINRYYIYANNFNLLLVIGALLFIISDSVIAINKFRSKFNSAEFIILSSYYLAQLLIAFSIP
ncbi:MAG: lysoplasmalogenase [Candidatus Sericytochromatia bacterium]|nr:lysoplasmalogenase [Candidatus Sericytochromatia bacterium]